MKTSGKSLATVPDATAEQTTAQKCSTLKLYGTSENLNKTATSHYYPFEGNDPKKVLEYINTHAVVPCELTPMTEAVYQQRVGDAKEGKGKYPARVSDFSAGYKSNDYVGEIYNVMRLDIDAKGEAEKVDKALKNTEHYKTPSTSNAKNPYKWHYTIPIKNAAQSRDEYNLQYYALISSLGISLKDMSMHQVARNMNPYRGELSDAMAKSVYVPGEVYSAPSVEIPKKPKKNRSAGSGDDVVDGFNAKHDAFDLLEELGDYTRMGDMMIRPGSETGSPGVFMFDDGMVGSYSGSDPMFETAWDAFEVFTQFKHGGDKTKAYIAAKDASFVCEFEAEEGYVSNLEGETIEEEKPRTLDDIFELKTYDELSDETIDVITLNGVPFPSEGLCMVAGDGGVGKSFVTVQLAVDYLKKNPEENTLFWFTEDYEQIVRSRIKTVTDDKTILDRMVFITAEVNGIKNAKGEIVTSGAVLGKLESLSKHFGMTVLDPLISFYDGNENDNTEARAFGNKLKKLHGLIVLIHHSSKGGSVSRGASDFRNMVRLVYKVEKSYKVFKKASFERRCEDMVLLGKRIMVADKDNWGVTAQVKFTARTDEDQGYIIDAFAPNGTYRGNVAATESDIKDELSDLAGKAATNIHTTVKLIGVRSEFKDESMLDGETLSA